jgi:hypothetical protein
MADSQGDSILVWTDDTHAVGNKKEAALPRIARTAEKVVAVSNDTLAANLQGFLSRFEEVLAKQPESVGGFQLDEIELSLAVNGEGGVELIGKMTVGVDASIKLKLKRK